jgi:hypothetical protein
MIAGLYPWARAGEIRPPTKTLQEIHASLALNPSYRDDLIVLAGDGDSAAHLRAFGLRVHRVFDDAPPAVRADAAHKMKHWMCRWALKEFGEFLWVDWDTVLLRPLDEGFWAWCRTHGAPKFIRIPNYWATVNCGVYYANCAWAEAMDRSFSAVVSEPNDELLWASVLPDDVLERQEYWWGERAVNVWTKDDFAEVTAGTFFAHVKDLEWAHELRALVCRRR